MRRPTVSSLLATLLLASCGGDDAAMTEPDRDPAISEALDQPIMVDPDLVGQNRANSAAELPTHDGSLPAIDNNPAAISTARAEALELVGGPGRMKKAPDARETSGKLPAGAALTVAARAAAAPGTNPSCAERAQ
jgi:hypothetical protein